MTSILYFVTFTCFTNLIFTYFTHLIYKKKALKVTEYIDK